MGRAFAEQALAINSQSSLALAVTALSHLYDHFEGRGSKSYENIFAAFDRALKLDPNNSNALNWQGIAHTYVGDNESAAAVHRRCIETDPALSACRSNLAVELLSLGRREEASAVVDAAVNVGAFAVGPGQMVLLAELRRRDAFLQLALNVPGLRGFRKFNALYDVLIGESEDPRLALEVKALFAENNASARAYMLSTRSAIRGCPHHRLLDRRHGTIPPVARIQGARPSERARRILATARLSAAMPAGAAERLRVRMSRSSLF